MSKFFSAIVAATLLSSFAVGEDFSEENHRVTGAVADCLNAPTRNCAFEVAMGTAISERLSIERAKVLIAVGRAMAETGKIADARMTLNMALEEARQSKISFAVDAKIMDLAPVLAMIGDIDRAIELATSVQIPGGRDSILSRAAEMVAEQGDVVGARKISDAIENRRRAIWVSLKAMKLLVHRGSKQGLDEFADSLLPAVEALKRPADKLLAMVRLSMIYAAAGERGKSERLQAETSDISSSFASYSMRARVAAAQLEYAAVGDDADAKNLALEAAITAERRIQGHLDKSSITDEMGPALAFAGHADRAVAYVRFYQEILEKSNYLKKVAQLAGDDSSVAFSAALKAILRESAAMENAYEADEVRMNLLFAARAVGDLALSREIGLSMKDDDNAAKALALLIPLI